MAANTEKGWFRVDGIRELADRTLEEQMRGLDRALAEAKGATVLDLGCAEGLIGREFARAGASHVLGVELLEPHLVIARKACADYPQMRFLCAHIESLAKQDKAAPLEQFDIVLALGVIHKLRVLEPALRWAASKAKKLFVFRSAAMTDPKDADYFVYGKRSRNAVNLPKLMRDEGFRDEGKERSAREEFVHYWRRA